MSLSRGRFYLLGLVIFALSTTAFSAKLSPHFYDKKCPDALATIKSVVDAAVKKDLRMGASLLRLHFHDCFVLGCDASVLLDQTPTIDSEKTAGPNINSLRGFDVVDTIKAEVDKACGRTVVSCADILAVAARDSVVALGGTTWNVPLGRRDSTNASRTLANANLPSPFLNLPGLLANFKIQGLNLRDLVALSGGHTVGVARCFTFRDRIYNNQSNTIDPNFAHQLQRNCPETGGDANLSPLDSTPTDFDTKYFSNLIHKKGLLDSDQALFDGGATEGLVKKYTKNPGLFSKDFASSMIKMGNINVLTGKKGQIRGNCRVVN